jgi:hypothetical protein
MQFSGIKHSVVRCNINSPLKKITRVSLWIANLPLIIT